MSFQSHHRGCSRKGKRGKSPQCCQTWGTCCDVFALRIHNEARTRWMEGEEYWANVETLLITDQSFYFHGGGVGADL